MNKNKIIACLHLLQTKSYKRIINRNTKRNTANLITILNTMSKHTSKPIHQLKHNICFCKINSNNSPTNTLAWSTMHHLFRHSLVSFLRRSQAKWCNRRRSGKELLGQGALSKSMGITFSRLKISATTGKIIKGTILVLGSCSLVSVVAFGSPVLWPRTKQTSGGISV